MSLLKLTNAPFDIEFNGKTYSIRKASLSQFTQFAQRGEQYRVDKIPFVEQWPKLVAYALFLLLSPVDPTLTEEAISQNIPGDTNPMEILTTLGFINPARVKTSVLGTEEKKPTTDPSLSPSATEQDGLPTK